MREEEYEDSYGTCVETYSTLRIFSDELGPDEIGRILRMEGNDGSFRKGDVHGGGKLRRKANGWFYSTEGLSSTTDTRRHIDLILSALEGREDGIEKLREAGCKIDVCSYFVSVGQGGPWLMPEQMLRLGRLGIEVWWDVYFREEGGEVES
jgi:hypothetical protein